MNFEYQAVGKTTAETRFSSLLQLATNIVTDWMPGTPNSLAHGFSDLLESVITGEKVIWGDKEKWIVQPAVRLFEKQWKQTTSWMLGVAFCRNVIEMEGYQFWAPVSAFTRAVSKTKAATNYWKDFLEENQCFIDPVAGSGSNLLPDYIIGRVNSVGIKEISFAESKGSSTAIANLAVAPDSWSRQSKNAQLTFEAKPYDATQNLLVATRVNPKGLGRKTRKIQVRAWNSREPQDEIPDSVFRVILMMHYYGICKRIGMEANAELIVLNNLIRTLAGRAVKENSDRRREQLKRNIDKLHGEFDSLTGRAGEEIQEGYVPSNTDSVIYYNSDRPAFPLGNRRMRVGFNRAALNAVSWLQGKTDNFSIESMAKESSASPLVEESQRGNTEFYTRSDGVMSNLT